MERPRCNTWAVFYYLAFSKFFKESYKNIFIVSKMVLTLPYVKHI